MNRQTLLSASGEWVRQAKNDIRNKVLEFMDEVETTREELAYALAISEGELEQILEGNGEITLTTFAKLLIATGNALEIKPLEETPLATEFGAPLPPMGFGDEHHHHCCHHHSPHNGHMCHRQNTTPQTPSGLFDDFEREEVESHPMSQPRGADGRFIPRSSRPEQQPQAQQEPDAPRSPFANMEREKLVEIIEDKLWDSEIDIDIASHEELVEFLEEKDRRINELKQARERKKRFEEDPSVVDFINKVRKAVETNPNLNAKLKDILR